MKCVYIYNPTSGKEKSVKIKDYVVKRLAEKYETIICRPTQKRGDAGEFAREACGVFDCIVISGGDGTMNEVINAIALMETRPTIGYIPTGTTNDLAHSLRIPKNVKKAVDIILAGKNINHDIFRVNDRFGIYVCAFGIFTGSSYQTSQKEKKQLGRLAYFKYGAKELFGSKPFPLTIEYENAKLSGNFVLGILANSRYVAGYNIDRMARCDDGFINVVLVKTSQKKWVSLTSLFRIFRLFVFGMRTLNKNKKCITLKLNKFKVQLPDDITINLDGEEGLKGSFDFEVLPNHVEIYVK